MFVMKRVEVRLRRSAKNPKRWADMESHSSKSEGWGTRLGCFQSRMPKDSYAASE